MLMLYTWVFVHYFHKYCWMDLEKDSWTWYLPNKNYLEIGKNSHVQKVLKSD